MYETFVYMVVQTEVFIVKPQIYKGKMATVKVKFRPSTKEGKKGTVFYKITHQRSVRLINTSYKIYPCEWNNATNSITSANSNLTRKVFLDQVRDKISHETGSLLSAIEKLSENKKLFSADDIVAAFKEIQSCDIGFITYARRYIEKLRKAGKPVAAHHQCAVKRLVAFCGLDDIPFSEVNSELMICFENWLKGKVVRNTSSYYMRNLRSIYNHAVEEGLIKGDVNPFRHVYTGIDKTEKRAIKVDDIKKIRNADLSGKPKLELARDLFMLSFYTQGMSFIDMAYLTNDSLADGVLTYRRSKTGQTIRVKWHEDMDAIVKRHVSECRNGMMLPIITETDKSKARKQYLTASRRINRYLKKLGKLLGISTKLTMYVARHSWATTAMSCKIPLSLISRSMGHNSERTTRIYLDTIDTSDLYMATEKVINSLT